ncbi:hypothetical protein NVIE_001720 [Nitrososphaera viennensis EN76]|uniref:Uncharacterized protein n=2 Tax=Nitrososphaera viennensis TaxID=1034015 RepID=A0A060HG63_9ARCH|nr:hypothetical protein NVIE_001720 [Nitrososphaera viennensis EN76]
MQEDRSPDGSEKQEGEFICVATFLPLKSWKYMLPFQLMTSKVLKQAKKSKGMVNYAVKANFPKKHFWTLSIWKDQDSFRNFVMAEPHATAIAKFSRWAGDGSAFVEWASSDGSIDWAEALKRLQSPTFYYGNKNTGA